MRSPTLASAVLLVAALLQAVPVQADAVVCYSGVGGPKHAGVGPDADLGQRYVDTPRQGCLSAPLDTSIAGGGVQGCVERNPVLRHACVDVSAPIPCVLPGTSAPPVLLSASREQGGVLLEWQAPATGTPAEYTIYRAVASGAGWLEATTQPLVTVAGFELSYLDGTAQVGVRYAYWLTATADIHACESPPSNPMVAPASQQDGVPPDVVDCIDPRKEPMTAIEEASLACVPEIPVGP